MSAMLGKSVPGHATPYVRVGHGCTYYFHPGENGTRAGSAAQQRSRRIACRREQRAWRRVIEPTEHA